MQTQAKSKPKQKIAIIGAGVAGLTTAWYLHQQQAFDVHLFDRQAGVANECSYANGGQLSVCNATSWHQLALCTKRLNGSFINSLRLPFKRLLS